MTLYAADVATGLSYDRVAWFLETGGLLMLFVSVTVILYGLFQGAREAGGRAIGYGMAMALAAGMSLYASVTLGRDPVEAATGSTWLYAVVAIVACLLYASATLNRSQHHSRRRRATGRGGAADGYTMDDTTQPRTSPRGRGRAGQPMRANRR